MPIVLPLDEEIIRRLIKLRRKVDITAIVEGETDKIFLRELFKLINPKLTVFCIPATGKKLIVDITRLSGSIQAILSKKRGMVKLLSIDCDDKRPGTAVKSIYDSLKARGENIEKISEGYRTLIARSGIHKLIILALGAYRNEKLTSLGVVRYAMEDYALLSVLEKPEMFGLDKEEIKDIKGETSKGILEMLADKLGRSYEDFLEDIFTKAVRREILIRFVRDLCTEVKKALTDP